MFDRRTKPSWLQKLSDFFWPRIGFKRSARYLGYRLGRLPGTPYSLAGGFAFGAAISFTPFVGLHFLFGGILAWIFRANILASAIGTAVGNPWTFPFIWTLLYNLGYWMLGLDKSAGDGFSASSLEGFVSDFWHNGWDSVAQIFIDILYPMLVASVPIFAIVWALFFFPLRGLIRKFHDRRQKALEKASFELHKNDPID